MLFEHHPNINSLRDSNRLEIIVLSILVAIFKIFLT